MPNPDPGLKRLSARLSLTIHTDFRFFFFFFFRGLWPRFFAFALAQKHAFRFFVPTKKRAILREGAKRSKRKIKE